MISDQNLGLAQAIAMIRNELQQAQSERSKGDVKFTVGPVEIELIVDIEKTGGGEASIKVLSFASLGAKGGVSRTDTNRLTFTLTPSTAMGEPFEVGSAAVTRPDGE